MEMACRAWPRQAKCAFALVFGRPGYRYSRLPFCRRNWANFTELPLDRLADALSLAALVPDVDGLVVSGPLGLLANLEQAHCFHEVLELSKAVIARVEIRGLLGNVAADGPKLRIGIPMGFV